MVQAKGSISIAGRGIRMLITIFGNKSIVAFISNSLKLMNDLRVLKCIQLLLVHSLLPTENRGLCIFAKNDDRRISEDTCIKYICIVSDFSTPILQGYKRKVC